MKTLLISISILLFSTLALASDKTAIATFAGGCFWCMEKPFDELEGVTSTISGYTDGHVKNPTYKDVSRGQTGHTEAIQITYDPEKVSYEKLLEVFWKNIDPTENTGQFCDKGNQYRPGIFYHNKKQQTAAEESLRKLRDNKPFKEKILTEITMAETFYPAEDYHQDYYLKNPLRYKYYRYSCGRDKRLSELWDRR